MSKLLCNIVSYRPDRKMLAANYAPRHVEILLDEAAVLIERCLKDFKEYRSLDYAWHEFVNDVRAEEKQIELDRQRRRWDGGPFEEEAREAEAPAEAADEESATAAMAPADATAGEPAEGEEGEREEQPEEESKPEPAPAPVAKSRLDLREEAVQRKKDLATPGQPFALHEQRDLVLKRLCRDYEEAMNRACVAEEGLRTIFGYTEITSPLPPEAETLNESLTTLAMWIRNSMEWLTRYQRQEQRFTRVVSIRSLLNRGMWTQVKHARDSIPLKLQIPSDLFRSHENCRLLGIGAALVGDAGAVQWSVSVRLPNEAHYERSGEYVDVDQSDLAPIMLGRVENRKSPRPPELCGTTTHLNASPFGRSTQGGVWHVEISRPAGSNAETFGHLEDLVLELSLAGIPKETKKRVRVEEPPPTPPPDEHHEHEH
ncbi:hypothetical protein LPW11_03005 [Geomonas sp. RF6]|uniref:hypothetical protein n=1 Tax=Geomonas sp. RF6 TaxID=2897342 RepID=UPI001E42EB0B|nr:hypothetical protein [Geomonas sp. RF6]UFS71168.1 hypothetical protein LPW11_03005 [Geomonas sp. RF6]